LQKLTGPFNPIFEQYRMAVGDILEVSVFGDEDTLVENAVVAPDGRIYYLFFDGISAVGLTVDELRETLTEKLKDWYLYPNVTVIPRLMSNNNFTILGRVQAPGLYPLNRVITARQAIGVAGGLVEDPDNLGTNNITVGGRHVVQSLSGRGLQTQSYNLKDSFIIREGKRLPIDFGKLIYSADNAYDIPLKPGDYIYIAANNVREVFVLGNVAAPAAVPYKEDLTLMCALAYTGAWNFGTPYSADMQNVIVIRGSRDCPAYVRVDLCKILNGEARNLLLRPGDIVYVHNKKFRFARELVELAFNSFWGTFFNDLGEYLADQAFDDDL